MKCEKHGETGEICPECDTETINGALYWIDFKHKKNDEEIRLQVDAESLEAARKKAEIYISKRFKIKEVNCVR